MVNKRFSLKSKIIKIYLLIILVLISFSCRAQSQDSDKVLEKVIGQVWIHSHEEDSADVQAYRVQEFDFPPSRGREGFQLNSDSSFIQYAIAPTDGVQKKKGNWTFEEGKLKVSIQTQSDAENFSFEIISLKNGILRARESQ